MDTSVKSPIGVLLMAYGGPSSLAEIPGYLSDIRSGRPTGRAVSEEITHNYAQIGGKSPLMEKTLEQVEAVKAQIDGKRYRVYLGMRHWAPWIEEVVGQMVTDGIERAVSMVLAPHYSSMSIAKYQAKIADGLEMYRGDITFEHVASYHDAPDYIQALVNRVQLGIARWSPDEQADVHVVFSAHSLPTRILKMGDPYQEQLWETAQFVANQSGLPKERWSWSYQSAGRSPEPWLGPQIEDHVAALAAQGIKKIVSIPIGFVSDHVEILFDIDIKAQSVAKTVGVRLERPPALNSDPLFIKTLVKQIEKHSAQWL